MVEDLLTGETAPNIIMMQGTPPVNFQSVVPSKGRRKPMNPFTRSLLEELDDPAFSAWVELWDQLESLVVEIYRSNHVGAEESRAYRDLRAQLESGYADWRDRLAPYWADSMAGGERLDRDPFAALFESELARAFLDDWQSMQRLPAAREALNAYLLDRLEGD